MLLNDPRFCLKIIDPLFTVSIVNGHYIVKRDWPTIFIVDVVGMQYG